MQFLLITSNHRIIETLRVFFPCAHIVIAYLAQCLEILYDKMVFSIVIFVKCKCLCLSLPDNTFADRTYVSRSILITWYLLRFLVPTSIRYYFLIFWLVHILTCIIVLTYNQIMVLKPSTRLYLSLLLK